MREGKVPSESIGASSSSVTTESNSSQFPEMPHMPFSDELHTEEPEPANEADENTVRRDSVPIDYDDLFATQKGESRMPSLKQHFFTRAFLDADLERRYQRGRFRYWKVQMFKTATMMTVAITYQTIVVVFKLRSLPLYSIALFYNFPAWYSVQVTGDYSFQLYDLALFTVAFTGVILCQIPRVFSLDNFQVFVVSLTTAIMFTVTLPSLFYSWEPAASPSNANGTWETPQAAVMSGTFYIVRTFIGMLITTYGVGVEPQWATILCFVVSGCSRMRYAPIHALRFGHAFDIPPYLELAPAIFIMLSYYHFCNYSRQAFVALVAVKVARAVRIEQLNDEKERVNIERAMLQTSIQRARAAYHRPLDHCSGASGGSLTHSQIILEGGRGEGSVSSSEFGRQWLENWAESREREIEQETHMRFEADVHKALQESLKEMMGEFSGHELADFTSAEGSLSPSHSMDASGDGSKANSRRPSISEARGSSAASGMSQRPDTEGYSLETKKDS